MTRPHDPVLLRQQLGARLRALREEAGVSMAEAADRVQRDYSWMSKAERGAGRISPAETEVLAGFYRARPEGIAELITLARMAGPARQSGMYREFSDVIGADFGPLLRLEATADGLRVWEPQVVPALLQTAEYARAVLAAYRPDEPDDVERRVALRLKRQALLDTPSRPALTCVISEAALCQMVGGAKVMAAQLARIVGAVSDGIAVVRVLRFKVGAYAATNGAFMLCSHPPIPAFAADGPDVVAYQDGLLGCVYHRERPQVAEFEDLWEDLTEKSTEPEESLALMNRMARDLSDQ